MPKQIAVFLEPKQRGEQDDDRRCLTVEPNDGETLTLQILGADQSAMEFLSQRQFEKLVTSARSVMGWPAPTPRKAKR